MEPEQNNQTATGGGDVVNRQPADAQPAPVVKQGYQGWLNSSSFLKRAFAIWGHYFVANLIISIVMFIVTFITFIVIGAFMLSMFSGMARDGMENQVNDSLPSEVIEYLQTEN